MEAKQREGGERAYVDFEPSSEWLREEECDTLLVHLPGFAKEQLRVLHTAARTLRISGERPIGDNRTSRFRKEFSIPENCQVNEISAKFEDGILFITQPKIITPAEQKEQDRPARDEKPPSGSSEAPPLNQEPQPLADKTPREGPEPRKSNYNKPRDKEGGWESAQDEQADSQDEKPESDEFSERKPDEELKSSGLVTSDQNQHENAGKFAQKDSIKDEDGSKNSSGGIKSARDYYKQIAGGLFMELKDPRKLKNLAVAVVLALLFVLYIKNYFSSTERSEN